MWYGLVVNGTLVCVEKFSWEPGPYDFSWGHYSRADHYEVVELSVTVIGKVPDRR